MIITAYRDSMRAMIESASSSGVPAALTEVRRLGRTLKRRATDVLAYFDRPGTSNGPIEAINGRLEHPRGSALGFRNLTNTSPVAARDRRIQAATTPDIPDEPYKRQVVGHRDGTVPDHTVELRSPPDAAIDRNSKPSKPLVFRGR